jgi:hypothetical protein
MKLSNRISTELLINIVFMMLICQPNFTIDVASCFVSVQANRSLVDILHNIGLRLSPWNINIIAYT